MKKVLLALLAAVVIGTALTAKKPRAVAASPQPPAGYDADVEEFWRRWEGDKPSEAVRHAAATPDVQRIWESIGHVADEFQNRAGGKCLGHSEIARRALGDRMEYIAFYALYDPTPIRVQMLYYCPKDRWEAVSLRVDSVPARWLEEASQAQIPVLLDPQNAQDR